MKHLKVCFAWSILLLLIVSCNSQPNLGLFEGNGDIGAVGHKGSVEFDPSDSTYTVAGSGTNMWFDSDELHYVWKKVSGDVILA